MTHQPGLPAYDDASRFPPRVWRAVELSRANGFPLACIPEVGRLLQLCAGGARRICELGTAYGVGAAWIESGMPVAATLLTVELDERRAGAAKDLFADNDAVEVLSGDWTLALEHGPFDLLFSDGGPKRAPGDPEKLLPLLAPDGLVVLDDYTPGFARDDPGRAIWLESATYRAVEINLNPDSLVIVATKREAAAREARRGSRSAPSRG
ncbi:MAG TPA: class I SAM-dependent methyltransferase [Candidatus Dormibacteraeota bacterium]|nr:class I SAM-dependent methyltransferase [Candidatus Dormibacteraeota bacterium]